MAAAPTIAALAAALTALQRQVASQKQRIAALERGQSVGNAERQRAAGARAQRLGPMAAALGWTDPSRRMECTDARIVDLCRHASPDEDGEIPGRTVARVAIIAALGEARSGCIWTTDQRRAAEIARAETRMQITPAVVLFRNGAKRKTEPA
jgi:hypothetical protein